MEQVHFFGIGLMFLLTLTLVVPFPRRIQRRTIIGYVRNMLATGTTFFLAQFLLQFHLGLRAMGVAQSVSLNLLFFVPASWMMNMAVLYLQRQKSAKRHEWLVGFDTWMIVLVLFVVAFIVDGKTIFENPKMLLWADVIGSVLFAVMQFFYCFQELKLLRQMHRSLSDYYDQDKGKMIHWIECIVIVLMVLALPAPLIIFGPTWFLAIYGFLVVCCVYYLVINFMYYVVSNDVLKVQEAVQVVETLEEESRKERIAPAMLEEERQRIGAAVNRWLERGGHLHNGITIQTAADEMNIPRYQFSAWLKTTEQEMFNPWLTNLRIEEAKRLMMAHPDWSNDVIAESCGFGSRTYFQTVFRKQTGMTPVQFISGKNSQ